MDTNDMSVTWDNTTEKWRAQVWVRHLSHAYYLGVYTEETDADQASTKFAKRAASFSSHEECKLWLCTSEQSPKHKVGRHLSSTPGVSHCKSQKGKWAAAKQVCGTTLHLGWFHSERAAIAAIKDMDEALLRFGPNVDLMLQWRRSWKREKRLSVNGDTVTLKLKGGLTSTIDRVDAHLVWDRAFHISNGYVTVAMGKRDSQMKLHRLILGSACHGCEVDHIDRNPLNNVRSNLRVVTPSGNSQNQRRKLGVSGFKGVYVSGKNSWKVRVKSSECMYHGGAYKSVLRAAAVASTLRFLKQPFSTDPVWICFQDRLVTLDRKALVAARAKFKAR